jgi:hypothetical protein
MKHFAAPSFWDCYHKLSESIQQLADKNFRLLKQNPNHSSLHFKKVKKYWSVRVGMGHRALGVESEDGDIVWLWIGTHREYDRLIK